MRGMGSPPVYDLNTYKHYDAILGQRYIFGGMAVQAYDANTYSYNVTLDVLVAAPIFVPTSLKAVSLGIYNNTAGGGRAVRLGLYTNTAQGNLYPQNLLVDSGVIDLSLATGVHTAAISQSVSGLVWVVALINVTTTCAGLMGAACVPILGWANTLNDYAGIGWTVAQAYGALPAVCPTAGAASVHGDWNLPTLAVGFGV